MLLAKTATPREFNPEPFQPVLFSVSEFWLNKKGKVELAFCCSTFF